MINSYKNLLRLLTGVVVLCAGSASAATFMDQFVDPTDPNQFIRDDVFMNGDTAVSNQSTGPFDSILGGFRDLELSILSSEDVSPQSGAAADVFGGVLRYNNDTGIRSELKLTYDGDDSADEINFMGLDENLSTTEGFSLSIIEADRNPFSIQADVYSRNGSLSTYTLNFEEEIIDDGTPEEAFFAFEDFEGDADFTDVGAVQFTFTGPDALDLRVGPIAMAEDVASAEVPEPTSLLALVGVSALGAVCGRRRCN